ncbi:MAG: T9SS type A sorting domain-containing protein [Candidatus Sabulitectum sp.]|nr:T9SS type A sorting domain-containing protein [Candidatus Sabulitectum sp.]
MKNGPGANGFHSHLWSSYWNTGYVPTFVADGVNVSAGWSQSTWTNHVNNRLAVPSYLTIVPEMIGDASGGTITYTLTAELDLVSFVLNTGTEEAMNAAFMDVPDTNTTGVASECEVAVFSGVLSAWPNPTTGAFAVSSFVPQGVTGTVEVFDITGRSVEQFNAGSVHNMSIERPGVYFIRLTTSSGEIVRRQIAVIR